MLFNYVFSLPLGGLPIVLKACVELITGRGERKEQVTQRYEGGGEA